MNWFRWYHGSVSEGKWPLIAKRSGRRVGEVVAVWSALLEYASQNEPRGSVSGFSCEEIDVLFGFEDGVCASIYAAVCQRGMIKDDIICAWSKRQVKDESAAERKQLQREREKLETLRADLEARLAKIEATGGSVVPSIDMSRDCPAPSQSVTECHLEQNREEQNREEKETHVPSAPPPPTETDSNSSAQAEELPKESGGRGAKKRQKHNYSNDFEQFWAEYPNTKGKDKAWRCWQTLMKVRASPPALTAAARRYAAECRELCREARYIMHGATFLGPDERWRDYVPEAFAAGPDGGVPPGCANGAVREEDFMLEGGGVDAKAFERARRAAALRRTGNAPSEGSGVG